MLVLVILFPVLSLKEMWREHRGVPASSDEQMICDVEFPIVSASGEWQREEQASFRSQR